jgi:hypothetical protein
MQVQQKIHVSASGHSRSSSSGHVGGLAMAQRDGLVGAGGRLRSLMQLQLLCATNAMRWRDCWHHREPRSLQP